MANKSDRPSVSPGHRGKEHTGRIKAVALVYPAIPPLTESADGEHGSSRRDVLKLQPSGTSGCWIVVTSARNC